MRTINMIAATGVALSYALRNGWLGAEVATRSRLHTFYADRTDAKTTEEIASVVLASVRSA